MNSARRDRLRNVLRLLSEASLIVDSACDAEQDALDNCPENLQATDRCEAMENAIESLSDASEKIDEAKELISNAIK